MKQYNIFAHGRKLNEHPIEAENEKQLEAFIEVGLQYDLKTVTFEVVGESDKAIGPKDLVFEKTSSRTFKATFNGIYLYTAYIQAHKISYIDPAGIWDEVTKTPLEWFYRMPNFNLTF